MLTKSQILKIAGEKGELITRDLTERFKVSRQYANSLVSELIKEKRLVKSGSTRNSFYVLPSYARSHKEIFPLNFSKSFMNANLQEHVVIDKIEKEFPPINTLPENVKSIFTYTFSEMLNNAIEHSLSKRISVEVSIQNKRLSFVVKDFGIGVFRNIMKKRRLRSELEAIEDLMKGKTTTMPKSHSGEGIFFTSRLGDMFSLESFGRELLVDNTIPDVFVKSSKFTKKGTIVRFDIGTTSKLHLNDIFSRFSDLSTGGDFGFDKTTIHVKLYTIGGIHISRSQARRILSGLEKFTVVTFDFDKVSVVGQAFADEIFRVFHKKYPNITLLTMNMNEGVKFMVERAKNEASKGRD